MRHHDDETHTACPAHHRHLISSTAGRCHKICALNLCIEPLSLSYGHPHLSEQHPRAPHVTQAARIIEPLHGARKRPSLTRDKPKAKQAIDATPPSKLPTTPVRSAASLLSTESMMSKEWIASSDRQRAPMCCDSACGPCSRQRHGRYHNILHAPPSSVAFLHVGREPDHRLR